MSPVEDLRKDFVLVTSGNYFGLSKNDKILSGADTAKPLNRFLDDSNVEVLSVLFDGGSIQFNNKVKSSFIIILTYFI